MTGGVFKPSLLCAGGGELWMCYNRQGDDVGDREAQNARIEQIRQLVNDHDDTSIRMESRDGDGSLLLVEFDDTGEQSRQPLSAP